MDDEKSDTSFLRVASWYQLLTFIVSGFNTAFSGASVSRFGFFNFLVKFQIITVSEENQRLIIVVLDAFRRIFVHRLTLQTPVVFDVDIVTTL